ncbi:hypothetical protein ACM0AX_23375 [Mycobacteroides abscessus subsp. abscessus]|uniref:rolling circle replication-associated protein n=1 Tax=Mycobacteroides abscessus TaxID=36809 RepID=UPI0039F027DB
MRRGFRGAGTPVSIVASTVGDVYSTAGAAEAGPVAATVPSARGRQAAGRESAACRERTTDGQSRDGLVICAKSGRDSSVGELRASDALGLRFPSPEMVSSAAALFNRAAPWATGRDRRGTERESGRFRIMVSPGVIRLGYRNPVRYERASARAVGRHGLDVANWETRVGELLRRAQRLDQAAVAAIASSDWSALESGRTDRVITTWSRKSRAMMCRVFAELDYTPLLCTGRIPVMVTFTYPGDWLPVASSGKAVKRHMSLWRKRFEREYDERARYIWKLEFQGRGAPHIHLWMAPPQLPGRSGLRFEHWLSRAWADVVDHPDPVQRRRHEGAGTAVDLLSGLRACDPKRLAIYFTKHSSPNTLGDKEYQNIPPAEWQEPGCGPGRFWGVYGLKKSTAAAEVCQEDYLRARRIVRRWSRNQAVYGDAGRQFPTMVVPRIAFRQVPRVDRSTGRVTYRRVRRRRLLCDQGGLAGGYVLVNDGPAFAAQLARAVSWTHS